MGILNDTRATLDAALAAASGLPSVAFENVKFDKDSEDEFIQVQFMVTSRRPAVRGPSPQMRYEGMYRLVIHTQMHGGSGAALDYADLLLTEFDGSTDISGTPPVSIEYSEIGDPFERDPFYCIPVEIAWYAYGT